MLKNLLSLRPTSGNKTDRSDHTFTHKKQLNAAENWSPCYFLFFWYLYYEVNIRNKQIKVHTLYIITKNAEHNRP